MRLLILGLALAVQTSMPWGQTRDETLQELAFAGDYRALEQAFYDAHAASLRGDISYSELRDMVYSTAVSHPQIVATLDTWVAAMPESPYAHTVRGWRYYNKAWTIRGNLTGGRTPQWALAEFNALQREALAHGQRAYALAPDFVPGSDLVLDAMNYSGKSSGYGVFRLLSRLARQSAYYSVLDDVMEVTPSHNALELAGRFVSPFWGGGGQEDVDWICWEYMDDLNDPLMDMDVCRVMVTGTAEREDVIRLNWRQLGDKRHPRLAAARAFYVMAFEERRKTPAEMEQAIDVLREGGLEHIRLGGLMADYVSRDSEGFEVLRDLTDRARAEARQTLIYDPFNLDALNVLAGHELNLEFSSHGRDAQHDVNLRQRIIVAQPYLKHNWTRAANIMKDHPDDAISSQAFAFYQNALFYGGHGNFDLKMTLLHLLDQLKVDYLQSNADAANDTGSPSFQITADAPEELVCHVIRYDRLLRDNCDRFNIATAECTGGMFVHSDHDRLIQEARATGMCEELLETPLDKLQLGYVEADFEDLLTPLNWGD